MNETGYVLGSVGLRLFYQISGIHIIRTELPDCLPPVAIITMKILAIERESNGVSNDAFVPHLKTEAARVWELYLSGALREFYFRDDQPAAVLILECDDVDAAQKVLDTLPLVKEGLITFDIIPLVPYPGLSRLFSP